MNDCKDQVPCLGRREFLVKAGLIAGGAVLTVSALGGSSFAAVFEDLTIDISGDSPLAKAGGSQVVDSTAGKIIVINEDGTKFAAFSARCTHKGVTVKYDATSGKLKCPAHGSMFDGATGVVVHGPAEDPLKSYTTKQDAGKLTVSV
ncbi:MAG TPA: Rieske (2Fe-2S) protein [Pyrinomonadaceae bacterium]|jgi:nitrite reductase/ring-hydroxylating ferredoxin subunit